MLELTVDELRAETRKSRVNQHFLNVVASLLAIGAAAPEPWERGTSSGIAHKTRIAQPYVTVGVVT